MEMAGSGAVEATAEDLKKEVDAEKKKKLNDDIVVFIRKRNGLDAPRLIAKLKSYVNFQHKRRRADAVRKRTDDTRVRNKSKRRCVAEQKEKPSEVSDHEARDEDQTSRRCRCDKQAYRSGWWSAHNSEELTDCGCRRRRRRRSRRRRSCRRRRRRSRRRRCRRRRSCRRRRRSRCRRRRRRSCRRRRRRSRRRRRR